MLKPASLLPFIIFNSFISIEFVKATLEDDILNYVSKTKIAQATCRLQNCQKLASHSQEKLQQCWTWCGKLPTASSKHNGLSGLSNEVEEVPINVSFSVRGCGLVWNIESESLTSVIYQVYSQDSLKAWHDEGQSVQNWINLSPTTLERTKAIRLSIIGIGKSIFLFKFSPLDGNQSFIFKFHQL